MKTMDGNTSPTIEELEKKNAQLENQMKALELKVQWYEEQFRLGQQKRFGSSSEKTDDNQLALQLFNEAEISSSVLKSLPRERNNSDNSLQMYTKENPCLRTEGSKAWIFNIYAETGIVVNCVAPWE
ncbi:transposase [Planococcus sp. 107-1]|uniref:transposase n=1 Tax=Planococcus sp. 107-1 TaxID=2908840 RepID=UPI0037CAE549